MRFNFFLKFLKRFDWLLMGAIFLLTAIGLVTLASLSEVSPVKYFDKQIVWVVFGFILLFAAGSIDFRIFKTQGMIVFLFYFFTVLLLIIVLLGHVVIRGASSWLVIGGVFIQPVEFVKLSLIILLAKYFSKRHIEIYRLRHILVSGVYAAIPAVLVLLQPNLGSAIILGAIWFIVVLFSGMKIKHFLFLVIAILLLSFVGWHFVLRPYQRSRIVSFVNPSQHSSGASYQMIQSMIAVGSGQIWGKGVGYGSQTHLHFLPEPETDFIFASFAEEWGFTGVIILFSLLFFLIVRIIIIGQKSSDNFSRLYSLGFASFIFVQSFIHIGMNMGTLPVTGITLPFVSYGGSSFITLCLGIGILQNIYINSRKTVNDDILYF